MTAFAQSSEGELVITRSIEAPAQLVFRAWTEPEVLMRWWAPSGVRRGARPAACALGTILRTLYMAGKVTQRPDIVPDPASKVARYLGWMEAELASLRT